MARTFTLENMETYFRNYIPCNKHIHQPITNFCLEPRCLRPMCPECVQQHSSQFESHRVESIKSCINRSSTKLEKAIQHLSHQLINSSQTFRSPEQYSNQYIKSLRLLRQQIIAEINQQFLIYEDKIKSEIVAKWKNVENLRQANNKLIQAIKQLDLLHQNLFITSTTIQTNRKINQIDFQTLMSHFINQMHEAKQNINFNVNIKIDQQINEKIRKNIRDLIQFKPHYEVASLQLSRQYFNKANSEKVIVYEPLLSARKPLPNTVYPNKPSPTKDRTTITIQAPNSFTSEPFLHFFEIGQNRLLHLLPLSRIEQKVAWQAIHLKVKFNIPAFHKSIYLSNGALFLIGGTWPNQRLRKIFQYGNQDLIEVGNLLYPRSSHSLTAVGNKIYIIGGITTGDLITQKCQVFDTQLAKISQIASVRHPCSSSALSVLNNTHILKIGGTLEDSKSCRIIQIYDIIKNTWQIVDPIIDNLQGEFELLSTSASIQINNNQIFVFGGYNEQINNEVSDQTYILEFEFNECTIKHINAKRLPIPQGFWNPIPVIHNNKLFCLQNIGGEYDQSCVESKRNVLCFDGRSWEVLF